MRATNKVLLTDFDDTIHAFKYASGLATQAVCGYLAGKTTRYNQQQLQEMYQQVCAQYVTAFTDGRTSHAYRTERMAALVHMAGLDAAKVAECVAIYGAALMRNLQLEPTVLDTLRHLHARHIRVIVVSEAPHDAQTQAITALGIAPYIEALYTSNQQRLSKPDGLWAVVMNALQLTPAECVIVGDSVQSDIMPAQGLNVTAVLYNPRNLPTAQRPCITEFCQIMDYLG